MPRRFTYPSPFLRKKRKKKERKEEEEKKRRWRKEEEEGRRKEEGEGVEEEEEHILCLGIKRNITEIVILTLFYPDFKRKILSWGCEGLWP